MDLCRTYSRVVRCNRGLECSFIFCSSAGRALNIGWVLIWRGLLIFHLFAVLHGFGVSALLLWSIVRATSFAYQPVYSGRVLWSTRCHTKWHSSVRPAMTGRAMCSCSFCATYHGLCNCITKRTCMRMWYWRCVCGSVASAASICSSRCHMLS